jgi:hypothetical protein
VVTGRGKYGKYGEDGVGELGAAATALGEGDGLSVAGAGCTQELLTTTNTSADTTSFIAM